MTYIFQMILFNYNICFVFLARRKVASTSRVQVQNINSVLHASDTQSNNSTINQVKVKGKIIL